MIFPLVHNVLTAQNKSDHPKKVQYNMLVKCLKHSEPTEAGLSTPMCVDSHVSAGISQYCRDLRDDTINPLLQLSF